MVKRLSLWLNFKKKRMKKLIFITLLTLCHLSIFAPTIDKQLAFKRFEIESLKSLPFSEDRLLLYLSQYSIPYKDVIIAQTRLETGNYTSWLFVNSNNLFGMRHPVIRKTTSLGSKYNHAYYSHWTKSVDDYILWYEYNMNKLDSCYYTFLKKVGYAEDKKYINKLKKMT